MHGRTQHRFEFKHDVLFRDVESILQVALLSIEGVHGAAAVRMHAAWQRDRENSSVTIDTSTPVGEAVARAFSSLASREFGETSYAVSVIDPCDDSSEWTAQEVGAP